MTQEIKEFIERNKNKDLYFFRDFDKEAYSDDLESLLNYVDDAWLNKCQDINELKDILKEHVWEFIDGVIIYHIVALAYLSECQAVEIPSEAQDLYQWANYELSQEVYDSIEGLE